MSAAVAELVDADTLNVLRAAAEVLADLAGGGLDVDRVMGDIDAVRGLAQTLAHDPALRARLRSTHRHDVLSPSDTAAQAAVAAVLTTIKARNDAARREERAQKRGTPEERRITRLEADTTRLRRERDLALARTAEASHLIDGLRAQIDELQEAVLAESQRADATAAAGDAARATLTDTRALALRLRDALTRDQSPLTAASVVVPDADRPQAVTWAMAMLSELGNPTVARARTQARALTVHMLGGGTEVGGSCALVTADDTRILVDAGVRPSAQTTAEMPPPGLAAALADGPVDAIVLTHAHADHIGWVPAILARHPRTPIFATAATADLLGTMWLDSAKIFRDRDDPPYGVDAAMVALGQVNAVPFGRPVHIGDLSFNLFPAGHILGAAGVHLTDGTHRAIVSGDVSGPGQRTVGGWDLPEDARHPDLLVLESTYGASTAAQSRARVIDDFVRDVELTVSNGGRVLVPAFAIGRAQEIAMICAERLPDVPVRIDGLARDITLLYEQHRDVDGKAVSIFSDMIRSVAKGRTGVEVETFTSGVVITTSGMLTAGPAVRWAQAILPDPRSALAVVGYQDPNSPGGRLLRMTSGETLELVPQGGGRATSVDVNATVRQYGLGAHASSDELVAIATQVRAQTTMLVHGDPAAREALAARLHARHLATTDAADIWQAHR